MTTQRQAATPDGDLALSLAVLAFYGLVLSLVAGSMLATIFEGRDKMALAMGTAEVSVKSHGEYLLNGTITAFVMVAVVYGMLLFGYAVKKVIAKVIAEVKAAQA